MASGKDCMKKKRKKKSPVCRSCSLFRMKVKVLYSYPHVLYSVGFSNVSKTC